MCDFIVAAVRSTPVSEGCSGEQVLLIVPIALPQSLRPAKLAKPLRVSLLTPQLYLFRSKQKALTQRGLASLAGLRD